MLAVRPRPHAGGLAGLSVGVSPAAVVAPLATVATLVRRQLRVAVRTDESQIFSTVVLGVSVDVVDHEGERKIQPLVGPAADRATTGLGGGEIEADVMASCGADERIPGFEPALCTGVPTS